MRPTTGSCRYSASGPGRSSCGSLPCLQGTMFLPLTSGEGIAAMSLASPPSPPLSTPFVNALHVLRPGAWSNATSGGICPLRAGRRLLLRGTLLIGSGSTHPPYNPPPSSSCCRWWCGGAGCGNARVTCPARVPQYRGHIISVLRPLGSGQRFSGL